MVPQHGGIVAITVPGGIVVTDQGALVQPAADQDPLKTALENTAFLYAYRPAHLACVFTCADKISNRSVVFEVPIAPSADGISYTFRHHVRTGTGTSDLTVKVDEWVSAAWNTIENSTTITAAANTVVTHSHADAVDSTATKLRFTYSRATGADELTPDSVCMYATGLTISAGKKGSGYVPFDDGLLTTAGSPIHTEHINRAYRDVMAVLGDAKQCAAAFVQESNVTYTKHEASAAGLGAGVYARLGAARFCAPYQVNPQITVYALASVDAGATTDIVRFRQLGPKGKQVLLDGDGAINSDTLRLSMPGGPMSFADLECAVTHTSGNEAHLKAVVAYWTPGD